MLHLFGFVSITICCCSVHTYLTPKNAHAHAHIVENRISIILTAYDLVVQQQQQRREESIQKEWQHDNDAHDNNKNRNNSGNNINVANVSEKIPL